MFYRYPRALITYLPACHTRVSLTTRSRDDILLVARLTDACRAVVFFDQPVDRYARRRDLLWRPTFADEPAGLTDPV